MYQQCLRCVGELRLSSGKSILQQSFPSKKPIATKSSLNSFLTTEPMLNPHTPTISRRTYTLHKRLACRLRSCQFRRIVAVIISFEGSLYE